MVDDDDELGLRVVVGFREEAAAQQGSSHGVEEIALNQDLCGEINGAGFGGDVVLGDEGATAGGSVGRQEGGKADAGHTGQTLDTAEEILIETVDSGLGAVLLGREIVSSSERVVGTVAEVGFAHLLEAAQQQARGGQQNDGDGDLHDDKSGAEAGMAGARGAGAAAFLQRLIDVGANGGEGRSDAAEETGDDRQREGKGGNARVEADTGDEGEGFRQHAGSQIESETGEGETGESAGEAESKTFQKHLAKQCSAARAKGEAHGDFAAAADGPDQEKSGQVSAGDEEDDGNGEEEGADEGTRVGDCVLMEPAHDGVDVKVGHEGGVVVHGFFG